MNWKRVLLSISVGLAVMVLQALLFQSTIKGTIYNGGLMGDKLSFNAADCLKIPSEYQKYCGNVTFKRFGYTAVVVSATQSVPENDYIINYSSSATRYPCPPSTYSGPSWCQSTERLFDTTYRLEQRDDLWIAFNFVIDTAVISALLYLGFQKFLPEVL